MSSQYDLYIKEHKENVEKAYKWISMNLPDVVSIYTTPLMLIIMKHDKSKYSKEEYTAYDHYFYGKRNEKVNKDFNFAWLHHIHENPHHWQHWVLLEDEGETVALDMPYYYIIEMICDWWSFSWKTGDLYSVFTWYKSHKKKMVLSRTTRETVERILGQIKEVLDNEKIE